VSAKAYAYTTGSVEGLSALSTDSYTYDTTNKDELTHFGGAFAPCNAMGYYLGYNGYLVSWTNFDKAGNWWEHNRRTLK
jgi:hypothetical protein